MSKKLAGMLATVLGAVAIMIATTACLGLIGHRPEVPAELLKK
jgi:cyclic lactone autoinducer peptide